MSFRLALTLLFACCVTPPVVAQEQPSSQHKELHRLAGEWTVAWHLGGQQLTGTANYRLVSGGMWVASDFHCDLGGIPYDGHGVDGYDAVKKKYISIWTDSMRSASIVMEGDLDDKTGNVVLTGTSRGLDGNAEKLKAIVAHQDADHFTFTVYAVADDGAEHKHFDMEYTRKK